MKKNLLLLTAIIALLPSCREKENAIVSETRFKGHTLTEIYLDNIPSDVINMNMSEVFADFSIIPLETNENCLIGAYNKRVRIAGDNIFFGFHGGDKPAVLLRFDVKGNFLNMIGSGGRGPGEHGGYDVYGTIPDEERKRVTVEWFGRLDEGPMTYSYDGTWIESIRYPMILLYGFYKWDEGEWFSCGSASGNIQYERDSVIVVFYNNNGEVTGKIPRSVYPFPASTGYTPGTAISVHEYRGDYKVFSPESDTVYVLSKGKLIPADIIHRGKNAKPYNQYIDPQSVTGKHDIDIVAETVNNYIFTKSVVTKADIREYMPGVWGGAFEADFSLIVADKRQRRAATVTISDDVFGILPAKYELSMFRDIIENRICLPLDAIRFLKMVEDAGADIKDLARLSVSPERLLSLTPDSNPVILTFTLKDHIRLD
ncbi:MAG: 6-bladed beta-propeller [Bacteroidales bacterium]|jgi:hypothetical protein|nr:6-bladed beta-propeller [Bacteroidales bacterium]